MYNAPVVKSQDDLLSESTRKEILKELLGQDYQDRRREAYKRQDCFRDDGKKYVEKLLRDEIGKLKATVLMHRIPNLSFLKKIVKKLARVYLEPPKRTVMEKPKFQNLMQRVAAAVKKFFTGNVEGVQEQLDYLVEKLNTNKFMKKVNRMVKLHRTVAVRVLPRRDASTGLYRLVPEIFHPGQFDAIVTKEIPTQPVAYVFLTLKKYEGEGEALTNSQSDGRNDSAKVKIVDETLDPKDIRAIWWSDKYHFTTDGNGTVVDTVKLSGSTEFDMTNPLGSTNIIPVHDDQDDTFWSRGGQDLTEGTLLLNLLLADLYYISKFQGHGLLYMTGENIPSDLEISPSDFLKIPDPNAKVGYASSNPNLEAIMKMVEQCLSILLTTNDLEPSTVSGKLEANQLPSGIAQIISESGVTSSISDDHEIYGDLEPAFWGAVARALVYASTGGRSLDDEFSVVSGFPDRLALSVNFRVPKPVVSEKENLEVIEKRRELFLDSEVDGIRRDSPDMDEKAAMDRLKKIMEQRAEFKKMQVEKGLAPDPAALAQEDPEGGDPAKPKKPPVPAGKDE